MNTFEFKNLVKNLKDNLKQKSFFKNLRKEVETGEEIPKEKTTVGVLPSDNLQILMLMKKVEETLKIKTTKKLRTG